jgi:hypothetical protein
LDDGGTGQQEADLIRDIELQACGGAPTEEQRELLGCVVAAAREYVADAHARLAELASKVRPLGMCREGCLCRQMSVLGDEQGGQGAVQGPAAAGQVRTCLGLRWRVRVAQEERVRGLRR